VVATVEAVAAASEVSVAAAEGFPEETGSNKVEEEEAGALAAVLDTKAGVVSAEETGTLSEPLEKVCPMHQLDLVAAAEAEVGTRVAADSVVAAASKAATVEGAGMNVAIAVIAAIAADTVGTEIAATDVAAATTVKAVTEAATGMVVTVMVIAVIAATVVTAEIVVTVVTEAEEGMADTRETIEMTTVDTSGNAPMTTVLTAAVVTVTDEGISTFAGVFRCVTGILSYIGIFHGLFNVR